MSIKAVGKYLPISARKGRQVLDIIRGKTLNNEISS